jgi:hypothetical protein
VRGDLPALGRILTGILPRVALFDLTGCFTLGLLSDADDLATALTVLWDAVAHVVITRQRAESGKLLGVTKS